MISIRPSTLTRLGAAALLALGTACSASLEPSPSTGLEDFVGSTGVPVTRLRQEPYSFSFNSGYTTSQRLVIRDAAAWSSAWSTIWQGTTPKPALPAIDFSKEMIVVTAFGQRSSGGYGILIDSAGTTGSELLVRVRSSSPGPRCFTTAALTQPVDVARIPASTLPVRFVEYEVVNDCP
jgi:hypothetical protein